MVCVVFRAVGGSQEIKLTWCFIMQLYSQQSQALTRAHTFKQEHVLAHPQVWQLLSLNMCFLMCFFFSQACYLDPSTWRRLTCLETGWTRIQPWLPWSPNPKAPQQVRRTNTPAYLLPTQGSLLKSFFHYLSSSSLSALTPLCLWNVWSAVSPPSSGRRERETENKTPQDRELKVCIPVKWSMPALKHFINLHNDRSDDTEGIAWGFGGRHT